MAKRRTPEQARAQKQEITIAASASPANSIREIVESVVVAIMLAFMVRTFEAEAFVIPTGSMAPTLLGSNKDTFCPQCQYNYTVGASSENSDTPEGERTTVTSGVCPTCGYKNKALRSEPTYTGDRIIVSKFAYETGDPKRWDVIVFRFPGDASENYIKRLVGLPGEIVRIQGGDIFVKNAGDEAAPVIARKPPDKIRAMMHAVHDTDHLAVALHNAGWPLAWKAEPGAGTGWNVAFEAIDEHRGRQRVEFRPQPEAATRRWLIYEHRVARGAPWDAIEKRADVVVPEPTTIHDWYAYNSREPIGNNQGPPPPPSHVGDLIVDADVVVESNSGTFTLRLIEGVHRFDCTLDVASGEATLQIDEGKRAFLGSGEGPGPTEAVAKTGVVGPGEYHVALANVDDQLILWVDDSVVEFDVPTVFPSWGKHPETEDDKRPVRIGAEEIEMKINRLQIHRDVFYIADESQRAEGNDSNLADESEGVEFRLGIDPDDRANDQFFVLGDNSPASLDSRLWMGKETAYTSFVQRRLLIGKALFIYWPHPRDDIFWFCPNFGRMQLVR